MNMSKHGILVVLSPVLNELGSSTDTVSSLNLFLASEKRSFLLCLSRCCFFLLDQILWGDRLQAIPAMRSIGSIGVFGRVCAQHKADVTQI